LILKLGLTEKTEVI